MFSVSQKMISNMEKLRPSINIEVLYKAYHVHMYGRQDTLKFIFIEFLI